MKQRILIEIVQMSKRYTERERERGGEEREEERKMALARVSVKISDTPF